MLSFVIVFCFGRSRMIVFMSMILIWSVRGLKYWSPDPTVLAYFPNLS